MDDFGKKNWQFFSFRVKPALFSSKRTSLIWRMWSSGVLENMNMFPRQSNANYHFKVLRITPIVLWKVPCVFWSPNAMPMNRYSLWWDVNAVSSLSDSSISICHFLLFESSVKKIVASPRESMHLSISGIGHELRFVKVFSFQLSREDRRVRFFWFRLLSISASSILFAWNLPDRVPNGVVWCVCLAGQCDA